MTDLHDHSVSQVLPHEIADRLDDIVVVDVREPVEFQQGHIPGSVLIPLGQLPEAIADAVPALDRELVLVCAVGVRSAFGTQLLTRMGYSNVSNLSGGVKLWQSEGLAWSATDGMPLDQRTRYSRHLVLPEVGEAGQIQLLASRVLIVGAGGLGSPVALYLAAAGVGTLGIVDFDVVDASNLHRQVLHNLDRLGAPKVESAAETIRALNPDVSVVTYLERLSAANVIAMFSGYDLVVDGSDNFVTRYLINDASLHQGIPVVHGAIFRFEGQASVFHPYQGPCYRCVFPQPPPPELAPSCAEAGVLGVLPGVIGSIQALEAIKLLLGIGEPLVGRLLLYDALDQEFRTVRIKRDPSCPACADPSRPPQIVDYDWSCTPAGTVAR